MSQGYLPQTASETHVDNRRPAYDGGVWELLPIVLVNSILTLLTLGIFRFWAKTRLRRYFLSRITLLDDRLVYTGTGKELFFGFLIVLAFFIPFGAVFQALSFWAQGMGVTWFGIVNAAYFVVIYYLLNFALFRANRYRLSRINWRGIRAGQTGSGLHYANLAMLYSLLVALTLGLAYPLMRNRLQAYKINHAAFGSERLSYDGAAGPLFRRWLVPWGVFTSVFVAGALWVYLQFPAVHEVTGENSPLSGFSKLKDVTSLSLALSGIAFLLFGIAMFWYRAAEMRHFTGHTRFRDLRFASTLRGVQILMPYLAYFAAFVLLLVLVAFLVLYAGNAGLSDAFNREAASAIGVWTIILFLIFFVLAGPLQTLIVQNMLLRAYCNSLTISGRISPERLLQSQLDKPARGEGLADALDVDAF